MAGPFIMVFCKISLKTLIKNIVLRSLVIRAVYCYNKESVFLKPKYM